MIPQGRLSTIPVPGKYLPPEDSTFYALVSNESGPITIGDTSQGLFYQNWVLTWNAISGDLLATAQITGESVVVLTVADIIYLTFTFDQNARITIAYSTTVSSYLYWFDTSLGFTVTTDLGVDVISPSISLDDKRNTQNISNDMLLWYTKSNILGYTLYMLLQRDRFLIENSMITGLEKSNVQNVGMIDGLRIQLSMLASNPVPLPLPIIVNNNDFELGDTGWIKTGDFTITQADPYEGLWSAILTTIPATFSQLINATYTRVVPGQFVNVSAMVKGSIATTVAIGISFYDASFVRILATSFTRQVTTIWSQIIHTAITPANALYARVTMTSNASNGTISFDNFLTVL